MLEVIKGPKRAKKGPKLAVSQVNFCLQFCFVPDADFLNFAGIIEKNRGIFFLN
jgi:hypothetical protein